MSASAATGPLSVDIAATTRLALPRRRAQRDAGELVAPVDGIRRERVGELRLHVLALAVRDLAPHAGEVSARVLRADDVLVEALVDEANRHFLEAEHGEAGALEEF